MTERGDVVIRVEGRAGRITLNRLQALNALTHRMALEIEKALTAWADDIAIDLVLIDAEGEKAFCAGGDIQDLFRTGMEGDYAYGRRFWADEYRLNNLIATYRKPYVALMDGIVMGGGVGISAHGSHRIVTERTVLAMPECGIGLIPDVGASYILGRAPGSLGQYLGLTGRRLKAAGAIHTGFADTYVPQERIEATKEALLTSGDPAVIADFAERPPEGELAALQTEIAAVFSADDPVLILRMLEEAAADGNWQEEAASAIRRASPISIHCAFHTIRATAGMQSVAAALDHEYRFVSRCMEEGDFLEGVRAQVIDKDRDPKWRHESLGAARETAERIMRPLEKNELFF